MKRIDWQTREPGHLEVDLVHHRGETSAGEYVHTLQMVDVATVWSEGKRQEENRGAGRRCGGPPREQGCHTSSPL